MSKKCLFDKRSQLILQISRMSLPNTLKGLLADGANSDVVREDGYAPLLLAVWEGKIDNVRILIDDGVNINYRCERDGATAFLLACKKGHMKIARYLSYYGADTSAVDNEGRNGLVLAIESGNNDLIAWLSSTPAK